jgi:16S rRNA (uracil1498-N3)-methyltransferase
MRLSRVYTPQQLATDEPVELTGASSHYLSRVLRLSEGDTVILFNGDGKDYTGEISAIERQRVLVKVMAGETPGNESPLKITLVQAICRGERMDFSLQKATELGVFCVQPLITERVEVRLDKNRQAKRLAHWQGVVRSACEQSGRAVVPKVNSPLSFTDWIALEDECPRLLLDPTASRPLSSYPVEADSVSILTGPEGGFSPREIQDARTQKIEAVSLGTRILRTETAGPAAITILQVIAGDF